ncbi:MAG: class I SAM-dependent methyltransferase [bacterium]|nr:class I SAM-dependent methyltransferase [bacterium]
MNIISRILMKVARIIDGVCSGKNKNVANQVPPIREEFGHLLFSGHGLQKLLDDFQFETLLDIGSGEGLHTELFRQAEKRVTAIDYRLSDYFKTKPAGVEMIVGDFNRHQFDRQFDCVWCSHVLEHQLNPHDFLLRVHGFLKEGGVLALTVPPLKEVIVGGHVSFWNPGLLLYRLVLAGFDCKDARVLRYGYNISVIIEKRSIDIIDRMEYKSGDIRKIRKYLPMGLVYHSNEVEDPFDGAITELNWML